MMRRTATSFRAARARRGERWRGDGGFTVAEMVVNLVVVSLVIAVCTQVIVTLMNDNSATAASLQGLGQAETATGSFVGYLQAAAGSAEEPSSSGGQEECTPSSSPFTAAGGDSMTFDSYSGTSATNDTPEAVTVTAEIVAGESAHGSDFNSFELTVGSDTVSSYDVNDSTTTPVFTYYAEASSGELTPIAFVANAVPSSDLASIVAVKYDIAFSAAPGRDVGGYAADGATEMQDTVWLQNCQWTADDDAS